MRILVTGASGFVGRNLLPRLKCEGHQVIRFVRGASSESDAFAGPSDLSALAEWTSWPSGVEAVIHLAANNPTGNIKADLLYRDNVLGTKAIAGRAVREGVPLVIFLSTANVHEAGLAEPLVESGPLVPQSTYAESKLQAETAFWSELAGSKTNGLVLRPAPVYGRYGRGNMNKLVRIAKLPIPLPIRGLGARRSIVSVDCLVDAIVNCLVSNVTGQTYLIADKNPVRPDEIVAALRSGWNRRPMLLPIPTKMLNGILGQRRGLQSLFQSFTVDTRLAERDLHWNPQSSAEKLQKLAMAGDF